MKKIFTLILSFVFVVTLATLSIHRANAVLPQICGGRPFLTTFKDYNYQGDQKIWCTTEIYGTPGWYDLYIPYVGDNWNDQIRSYKLWSWPQYTYTVRFYKDANFNGTYLNDWINHNPEANPNTCNLGYVYCQISSLRVTSHPW